MHPYHRIGWIVFIVSALLFAWAGVRARDWLTVGASIAFGAACVLFLVAPDVDD